MTKHPKVLLTAVSILVLVFFILACGLLPTPTPTPTPTNTPTNTPTPTATPTPTPTPTPTNTPTPTPPPWQTYIDDDFGFSLSYPDEWFRDVDKADLDLGTARLARFASSAEFLVTSEDGASLFVLVVPLPQDIDLDELWDPLTEADWDIEPERDIVLGGQDAKFAMYDDPADDRAGWAAMVVAYKQWYVLESSVSPAEDWDMYADTLDAMLESIEIYRPR
jgi:hypothetical protein